MRRALATSVAILCLSACSDTPDRGGPADAAADAALDGAVADGGRDLGADLGTDAGFDAGTDDAGVDDAGFEAGVDDAGFEAGMDDAGFDAGVVDPDFDAGVDDAGIDAAVVDAGVDAGCVAGSSRCESGFRLHACVGGVDTTTDCPMVCAGTPPACLACVPDSDSCIGDDIVHCRPDGSARDVVRRCAAGCNFGACRVLSPVNLATNACRTATLVDLVIASDTTLDTTLCSMGTVRAQVPAGPSACVVIVHDVTIAAGATLTVIGAHPLILVATNALLVDGTIDASARSSATGSGATSTGLGGTSSGAGGGGGGGYASAGATGGATTGSTGTSGGSGGVAYGTTSLAPLVGGSSGGSGARGGGGGGALELVGCETLSIGAAGVVSAGGGGGGGGDCAGGCVGGGGGGSGGAIILEAADLVIASGARITANGGAGACSGIAGVAGENGRTDRSAAGPVGGACALGTSSGLGAFGSAPPTTPGTDPAIGGGGGGSVGLIRIGERVFSPEPGIVYSPDPSFVGPTIP